MITANEYYRRKFGCKVYKLSLDGGFTCPNRDGTLGTKGCLFCSEAGGGDFAEHGTAAQQLEQAKKRVSAKIKGDGKYIAYLQAFTNTYGPVEKLRKLYLGAIEPDDIAGLAIGTRPDCLQPEILSLLSEINQQKPVSIELGLQTSSDQTARIIRRGYPFSVYRDAVRPGADGKANNILGRYGLKIELSQLFYRAIGVGKGLEIGNIFTVSFYFAADPLLCQIQLLCRGAVFGKIAASCFRAEKTAFCSQSSIPVGTGKASVQRQLIYFAAKFPTVILVGSNHSISPFLLLI